jgi:hypothetical protein
VLQVYAPKHLHYALFCAVHLLILASPHNLWRCGSGRSWMYRPVLKCVVVTQPCTISSILQLCRWRVMFQPAWDHTTLISVSLVAAGAPNLQCYRHTSPQPRCNTDLSAWRGQYCSVCASAFPCLALLANSRRTQAGVTVPV